MQGYANERLMIWCVFAQNRCMVEYFVMKGLVHTLLEEDASVCVSIAYAFFNGHVELLGTPRGYV